MNIVVMDTRRVPLWKMYLTMALPSVLNIILVTEAVLSATLFLFARVLSTLFVSDEELIRMCTQSSGCRSSFVSKVICPASELISARPGP